MCLIASVLLLIAGCIFCNDSWVLTSGLFMIAWSILVINQTFTKYFKNKEEGR